MQSLRPHHFAISALDLSATKAFYELVGFQTAAEWTARDKSLVITHMLGPAGITLEVFTYAQNGSVTAPDFSMGNDLEQVGVKHLGFHVDDLNETRAFFSDLGKYTITDIIDGRTGIQYFFVKDPNGIWVEFVHENRDLDVNSPIRLQEQ